MDGHYWFWADQLIVLSILAGMAELWNPDFCYFRFDVGKNLKKSLLGCRPANPCHNSASVLNCTKRRKTRPHDVGPTLDYSSLFKFNFYTLDGIFQLDPELLMMTLLLVGQLGDGCVCV